MKWDKDKSITLSIFATRAFMLLLIAVAVGAYWIINWYVTISWKPEYLVNILLVSTYACCVPASIALYSLNKLLTNIKKEIIFSDDNVKLLRILSWCCVLAGVFTFLTCLFYPPVMIVCLGALFMALIVRVVKNCFEMAVEIKEENDMTI